MRGRSGFRARGVRPFAYFPQNGRCRIAGNDGNGEDAPASSFHFLAANNLVAGPIATLHQDIREQTGDHFAGRQIIEDHYGIHTFQSRENFRALEFRDNRAAFALQLTHAGIAIQPDDKHISQLTRQLQTANVARMKQIKAAVREDDDAAVAFLAAKPQNRFLECQDCRVQRVSMRAEKNQSDIRQKSSLSRAGGPAPAGRRLTRTSRNLVRAIAGVLLCVAGFWLALPTPYRERTFLIDAAGCRLETTIVVKQEGGAQGSVLLFHGISANKKIMSYLARGFAEQGLRVYVPDLPGHGRTPGPFSPARAEQCGEALLRELLARGVINADRTILAGHSMGGAIAERIASRVAVAGLIAISIAPMRAAHGVTPEKLVFSDPPALPPHSLVIMGSLELESMRGNAADLVASRNDGTVKYLEIPGASHVGILFNRATMRASQEWSAHILNLPTTAALPSHRMLMGALGGFVGILLIAGPFLREVCGKNRSEEIAATGAAIGVPRLFLEFAAGSLLIVVLLRFWIPLKVIGLFEGDYLASFLLLLGAVLVAMHWNSLRFALSRFPRHLLVGGFVGVVLLLLATAWLDLTFYEAWLTASKWARFPFLMLVLLPYLVAEETLLGPVEGGKKGRRLALALSLRLISWGALMAGVLILHNGEILMGLLALYMALFNLLQRRGMDIVRTETGSAAATALFGAILQTGFCLVIFPLT